MHLTYPDPVAEAKARRLEEQTTVGAADPVASRSIAEATSDARAERTVAMIDAVGVMLEAIAERPLGSPQVIEAIRRLAGSDDLSAVLEAAGVTVWLAELET